MKENLTLKSLDVKSVESLEGYLLQVALLCISMRTLATLHEVCISKGIFNDDEIENGKTIIYRTKCLITSIDDQVAMCVSRTEVEWPQMVQKVMELLTEQSKKQPAKRKKAK